VKIVASAVVVWVAAVLSASALLAASQQANQTTTSTTPGQTLFSAQCAFCHGRDATGGASGPDLTDSSLVGKDVNGDLIGPVVRSGRPEKGMPPFALSDADLKAVVTYIHAQKKKVDENPGRRRKVSVEDISTGNADAGKRYFESAGGCTKCHSATKDLTGIASRYRGLALMQRMLYPTPGNAVQPAPGEKPKPNPAKVTVTLPSGQTISGSLVHQDEFIIALTDASGWYRSWPTAGLRFTVDDPLKAHADQLPKYTDDDIHNLVAYLQTLKF
jgi:cytochrome c oxidase cbb3-type subunit 3